MAQKKLAALLKYVGIGLILAKIVISIKVRLCNDFENETRHQINSMKLSYNEIYDINLNIKIVCCCIFVMRLYFRIIVNNYHIDNIYKNFVLVGSSKHQRCKLIFPAPY